MTLMKRTEIKHIFDKPQDFIGKHITVCGWVRTSRDSKAVCFVELNDGSSFRHIQVVIDKSLINDTAKFLPLSTALQIQANCVLAKNDPTGIELEAQNIVVLGASPANYPIQKKPHTLEFLRTMPHLRLRTNTFMAISKLRHQLSYAIHKYFYDNGYHYVHTPIITGSDCEGAGETFRVTTHTYKDTFDTKTYADSQDFFGTSATLTVSGQMEGEVAAMALGKIYTFGPTFRAENSNTARHAAEFWMIEPEVAFADIVDIMNIAQEMIQYIIRFVFNHCQAELSFFEKFYEKNLKAKLQAVLDNDFVRIDYTKAIELVNKSDKKFEKQINWGDDLATEHERYLTEEVYHCPIFVINYPAKIKSFYMKQNSDGKTVAATDLLVPGVGEIIGCSEREADYTKLLTAMQDRNMNIADYQSYLDLRKFGSVPHSGFGLGLERMLMYISGISNIRDTQLYPRASGELR